VLHVPSKATHTHTHTLFHLCQVVFLYSCLQRDEKKKAGKSSAASIAVSIPLFPFAISLLPFFFFVFRLVSTTF
jgi:hypothetical protein